MGLADDQRSMLLKVATALGNDMLNKVAFVGGCATGLLITDDYTREQVRGTDDVDLIIHIIKYSKYEEVIKTLESKGFKRSGLEDEDCPTCAIKLGGLRVDLMPDTPILGSTNRWYKEALNNTIDIKLGDEIIIKVVNAPFFVATKLEAYNSRGNNDPLESRDIEDILNLIDGRQELEEEIKGCDNNLREYISNEIKKLLHDDNFGYAIQSQARGNQDREDLILEKLESLIGETK